MATLPLLPPRSPLLRKSSAFNNWSVNYGAVDLAIQHAEISVTNQQCFYAVWAHGVFGPWEIHYRGRLTFNSDNRLRKWPIFTAREEEQELLKDRGFKYAKSIGMPIVYAPIIQQPRIANSLLIVPTHTLPGITFPDRTAFKRYAEEIKREAKQFDHVFVCLHQSCFQNGLWLDEFTGSGYRLILGAAPNDINSLCRMRSLFSAVECVTTNGWGSHVAYALAEGANVSIFGTEPRTTEKHFKSINETTWGRNPDGLRQLLSEETYEKKMAYLSKYTCPPNDAQCDVEHGKWLIGADQKLSPKQMRDCLETAFHGTLSQRAKYSVYRLCQHAVRCNGRLLRKVKSAPPTPQAMPDFTEFQRL